MTLGTGLIFEEFKHLVDVILLENNVATELLGQIRIKYKDKVSNFPKLLNRIIYASF
jgi:hypothetical protein